MKNLRHIICCLVLSMPGMAWAETDNDYEEATFTGKKDKPIKADIEDVALPNVEAGETEPSNSLQLYPDEVYEGARVLNIVPFLGIVHVDCDTLLQHVQSLARESIDDVRVLHTKRPHPPLVQHLVSTLH